MDKEMKALLDKILAEQVNMRNTFDGRFEGLEGKMGRLESRMDGLEGEVKRMGRRIGAVEARQDEIYHLVKAIEYSSQVARAEIDTLKVKAAKTDGTFEAIKQAIK